MNQKPSRKRHLVNSKYGNGKKPNPDTFIRKAPPSLSEQKIPGFLFLKEFTSVCVLFVIFFQLIVAFGYKLLSLYLLPHSCLKFPLATAIISFFSAAPRPCALTQTAPLESVWPLWALLSFRKMLLQQRRSHTRMALGSPWKCNRLVPGHKGALVGLFIYRPVKT